MTKSELESKPLSELHSLAAEAGVAKYRMLTRTELIDALSGSQGGGSGDARRGGAQSRERSRGSEERPARKRRRRRGGSGGGGTGDELGDEAYGGDSGAVHKGDDEDHPVAPDLPDPKAEEATLPPAAAARSEAGERPKRRRRRRFGRRSKEGVTIQDLLLPAEAGRQAILCAESREACTALLRGVASDLAAASKGPDPVVLLIDPSPEELGDWKREAPQAEIVAAGQARHASDALAQAANRAGGGEDVMLLVDSLTRLATDFADTETAKEFFDAGRTQGGAGGGSLTIVAAIERS
ncbi:MAG TPA: Rho termination factor N-terminal domain-containing protein [Solirubrobacterales bacterium]|nr:Rho termination factor N-terminal domain-containing protein [Solirubrobacterales bacterium]